MQKIGKLPIALKTKKPREHTVCGILYVLSELHEFVTAT